MKAQSIVGLVALLGVTATVSAQNQLVVSVSDQHISVPTRLESGYTEFVLDNQASGVYAHEIVRLKDGGDARAVQQALPSLFSEEADEATFAMVVANTDTFLGGAVGTVPGGERSVGLTLTPGTYIIYADKITDSGLSIDLAHTAILTVTEAADPTPEPKANITIKMVEYAFALPANIAAGTHLVRFENVGNEDHLGFVFALPEGMSAEEARHSDDESVDWSQAQGVHAVGAGASVYAEMTFEPGRTYLFDCPIPNDKGVSHDELGMMQFLTVVQ